MKPTIAILAAVLLCGCGKQPDQKSWTLRSVNTNEPVTITVPPPEEVENPDPDIVMDNRMVRMVPNNVVTNELWIRSDVKITATNFGSATRPVLDWTGPPLVCWTPNGSGILRDTKRPTDSVIRRVTIDVRNTNTGMIRVYVPLDWEHKYFTNVPHLTFLHEHHLNPDERILLDVVSRHPTNIVFAFQGMQGEPVPLSDSGPNTNSALTDPNVDTSPNVQADQITNNFPLADPVVSGIAFWDKDSGLMRFIGHAEWKVQTNWVEDVLYLPSGTHEGYLGGPQLPLFIKGSVSSNLVCVIEWKEKRFTNILESIPITNVVRTFQEKVIRIYE